MIGLLRRAAYGVVPAVIVAVVHPAWTGIAFRVLVLYLGAVLLVYLVARTGTAMPRAGKSAIEQALSEPPPKQRRVAELERLERIVTLSVAHAGDVHTRLRPMLAEIATPLLAARGIDLERDPERARELLGDEAWELIRPDAPRPADPFDPGTSEASIRAAVEALERMAG